MSKTTTHHATVAWDGDKRDLRAHAIRLADQTLAGSCMPAAGGDPAKADPEELFVASISACHMLWFLDYARRERLRVLSYEDHPEGTMDAVRFIQVALRPRVTFATNISRDVLDRLHREAHEACFIANSIACEVRIDLDASDAPHDDAITALGSGGFSVLDLVEAVRALQYGRPSDRTVEGMLRERRGTCSTKHLFLAEALAEHHPETEPQIIHRVYSLDRARASALYGPAVADTVPEQGLIDVHRYLTIAVEDRRITIDATFPGPLWDGRSPLPLACGPGKDHSAGKNPDAESKRRRSNTAIQPSGSHSSPPSPTDTTRPPHRLPERGDHKAPRLRGAFRPLDETPGQDRQNTAIPAPRPRP
jgi:organic hydroperoxide reductase OsmC/OhrA